jgi:hypothetical protein
MRNSDKLQAFAEIACYGSTNPSGFIFADLRDNKDKAEEWFKNELNFLGKKDAQDLKHVWRTATKKGDRPRTLFNAVKILQDKYV